MKFVWNFLILTVLVVLIKGQEFDHKDQAKWLEFDDECHHDSQSPIELNSFVALPAWGYPSLKLKNFHISLTSPAVLRNNGHSADIQLPSNSIVSITGGPLFYREFKTESMHFHWGSRNYFGSEHIINNRRRSMEMHIVNRNTKYATMAEAIQHSDGLSVLAALLDVDPNQQVGLSGLNSIVNSLSAITPYNSSTLLNNLRLADLLAGIDIQKFFTYHGSLTTPPCSQAVSWIVFAEPIAITEEQVEAFRLLTDTNGENLVNNFRHLQPKGNRPVYLKF